MLTHQGIAAGLYSGRTTTVTCGLITLY